MNKYKNCRKQIKYNRYFLNAINNTNNIIGCKYKKTISRNSFIDKKFLEFIGDAVSKLCQDNVYLLAGQCIRIHWQLANEIRHAFGIDAFVTLGDAIVCNKKIYSFDLSSANTLLSNAPSSIPSFSGHAWITLTSGEIIDASIQTTIGLMQNDPEFYGNIIAQKAGSLNDSIEFIPSVVGDDYLFRSGLVQEIT
ncbi:hypothetical protein [Komagataeibacter sp. NFXK3]